MKPLINLAEDYRKAAVVLRLAIEDRREQAAQGKLRRCPGAGAPASDAGRDAGSAAADPGVLYPAQRWHIYHIQSPGAPHGHE